jgi:hypothetical protein
MYWLQLHPAAVVDHLGAISDFIDYEDARPAAEQINENYEHGGGWNHQEGFTLNPDATRRNLPSYSLQFEAGSIDADPPLVPLWATNLRDELVIVYEYGYTAIFQPDNSFQVSRLD